MTERGFITPPPGLLPEPPQTDTAAPAAPRVAPPAFFPAPPGAGPAPSPQQTEEQPTVSPPPSPSPPPPVTPAPVAAPATGPIEAALAPAPGEATTALADWMLAVDGASQGRIPDVLVLGRSPGLAAPGAQLLAVSGGGTVSATHAIIRRDGDALTIEDLGSTNGTAVIVGDSRTLLTPHQPMRLTEPAEVWLAQAHLVVGRS